MTLMADDATTAATHNTAQDDSGKIGCAICGARTHMISKHLTEAHKSIDMQTYKDTYPSDPLLSSIAQDMLDKVKRNKAEAASSGVSAVTGAAAVITDVNGFTVEKQPMNELFKLGRAAAAFSHDKKEIAIQIVTATPDSLADFIPEIDDGYVFDIDTLKIGLMGIESDIKAYMWGHMGTGKSTLWEQICARTGRPWFRVQHTRNTEESHIVGQWIVKDGETKFELGPLAFAMKHGLVYLADEYDFAMPAVLALYQPVLEGKPLVIKEADHDNRIIKPHPMFRFVATGNTNGTGDETGLYQGTLIQNAANYERFGIVHQVHYLPPNVEVNIITSKGKIDKSIAEQMVKFAGMIRDGFANGTIGVPISPRSLINAATLGRKMGKPGVGMTLAYINRLTRADQDSAREILTRCGLQS